MSLKNINLEVSKYALKCVETVINHTNEEDKTKNIDEKSYKTLVKKMPTLIQKNGLINTLVFNLSKPLNNKTSKNKCHREVLKNIIDWTVENPKLCNIKTKTRNFKESENKNIDKNDEYEQVIINYIKWVTDLNPKEYRLVTKEMMMLFGWIKRFSDGMIKGDEEHE
ncbi:type III-B CRISPR module-associated protein Cmr5 [Anaerovorax odorimutans]|uniref:type III-B CRISPR module-associated protein Cmr5 n=1 Tax=Anaerovorax odorimutans TaxID=109327 RepID=UPI000404576D|nr:type III-B CRISPR module-associated protein Cmr5 [Anaerovorax odorimutans]